MAFGVKLYAQVSGAISAGLSRSFVANTGITFVDTTSMTPREFSEELRARGFYVDSENKKRYVRVQNGITQYVARESVRGSAWRLHMAVGQIPTCWPTDEILSSSNTQWRDAESPWFYYYTEPDSDETLNAQCDTKDGALLKCFDWLIHTGTMWLENADARADDRWRIDYNILVRRHQ
jgi:hypothetical protein